MSYVRWSSDDFRSDVYCYESSSGFETHVASWRHVPKEPLPSRLPFNWPPRTDEEWAAYWARLEVVSKLIDAADIVRIGGPHDGASFIDESEEAMGRRLVMLREAGYHVPEGVIEALLEPADGGSHD